MRAIEYGTMGTENDDFLKNKLLVFRGNKKQALLIHSFNGRCGCSLERRLLIIIESCLGITMTNFEGG